MNLGDSTPRMAFGYVRLGLHLRTSACVLSQSRICRRAIRHSVPGSLR